MGEAKEVGRALDREFPLRWLVLSRLALAALVLAIAVASPFLFPAVAGAAGSLRPGGIPPPTPLPTLRNPLPWSPWMSSGEIYDGTILSLYGVGLRELPRKGIIPPISTLFSTIGITSGAPPCCWANCG